MILCIFVVWTALALALGFIFGKALALADERAEQQYNADLAAAMARHPSGREWVA